jgi:uncharacterized membrane protein
MNDGVGRCEAFSDGIFAIAATLLVLDIRLPHVDAESSLWAGLLSLWPSYLAFTVSFFVILISWVTHHDLMRQMLGVSRKFLFANGFFLFYIAFVPFPTSVLAANLAGPHIRTAVAFYCGTFVLGSVASSVALGVVLRQRLFRPEIEDGLRRRVRTVWVGFWINIAATMIALVFPWLALTINVGVRALWIRLRTEGPAPPMSTPMTSEGE